MSGFLRFVLAIVFVVVPVKSIFAFGEVIPLEAYSMATGDENTFILDVRTPEEWRWVGHPGVNPKNPVETGDELEGKVINVSYMILKKGAMMVNRHFLADVEAFFGDSKDQVTLIIMCRSGGRAARAAALLDGEGYFAVNNMLTGFEGGKGTTGVRDVAGWKVDGLPYNDVRSGAYDVRQGGAYGN